MSVKESVNYNVIEQLDFEPQCSVKWSNGRHCQNKATVVANHHHSLYRHYNTENELICESCLNKMLEKGNCRCGAIYITEYGLL